MEVSCAKKLVRNYMHDHFFVQSRKTASQHTVCEQNTRKRTCRSQLVRHQVLAEQILLPRIMFLFRLVLVLRYNTGSIHFPHQEPAMRANRHPPLLQCDNSLIMIVEMVTIFHWKGLRFSASVVSDCW